MLSTSTIAILKALNPQEFKRFGDFINSPYHNSTKGLDIIYKIVLKAYPDFTSSDLEPEEMAKKVFGAGAYKEKRLNNLCAEFGNLLRKFIGYEEMNNYNIYELDIFISNALIRKDLFETAKKLIDKSIKQNDSTLILDDVKEFYKFRLLYPLHIVNNQESYEIEDKKSHFNLEALITQFLRDSYIQVMAMARTHAPNENQSPEDKSFADAYIESLDMNKFLNYLKGTNHKYYSYLKIHYLLYYYSTNSINEEQFYELKNEIIEIVPKVLKDDAYVLIRAVLEIVYKNLLSTDKKYHIEAFELGKLLCELNFFPNNTIVFLPILAFNNLFTNAIIIKEYEWAENFVNEYIQYIAEEYRDTKFNFFHGILSFKRGRFEESLNFFSKVKVTDIQSKLHLRYYYLMNYIELKAYESARSSLEVLRNFNHHHKVDIPHFIENIMESLKYFSEIIKCEEQNRKIDEMIYIQANDGRNFTHKAYILEKMEKLK